MINETYKDGLTSENPYITMWGAEDVLNFYGTFLAFIGTVSLGFVAYKQNEKANAISDRLLRIEEERQMPLIDFFDYEIDLNTLVQRLPVMSFNLSENPASWKEIRILVRNINEIPINKIEIVEIEVFQTSPNNTSSEVKHQFDETMVKINECDGYMNQLSPLEYKELVLFLPTKVRTSNAFFDTANATINTRLEMVLRLTTYSQRTYLQKIELVNYCTCFSKENKFTSKIINKHVAIKEDK